MSQAHADRLLEDARVRVTRWTFDGPGAGTGEHTHEFDYVVVPVSGGRLEVRGPSGEVTEMVQRAGEPYPGTAGTRHDVVSRDDETVVFVEVELLPPA